MGKGETHRDRYQWGRRPGCVVIEKGWKEEGTYYLWTLLWAQAVLGTLQTFSHLILTTTYYFHLRAEKLCDFLKVTWL